MEWGQRQAVVVIGFRVYEKGRKDLKNISTRILGAASADLRSRSLYVVLQRFARAGLRSRSFPPTRFPTVGWVVQYSSEARGALAGERGDTENEAKRTGGMSKENLPVTCCGRREGVNNRTKCQQKGRQWR